MNIKEILEHVETALALAGYEILDGDNDSLIIRHASSDTDYEVKVSEIIP